MDHYYKIGDTRVHWIQLIVTIAFVIALTTFIFCMLQRGIDTDARNLVTAAMSRVKRRQTRIKGEMEIESSARNKKTP